MKNFFPLQRNQIILLIILGLIVCLTACGVSKNSPNAPWQVRTFFGAREKLGEPFGMAAKGDEIFVADGEHGKILRIGKDGNATVLTDRLNTPSQIVFDKNGDLIVADTGTHTIKKVKPNGEIETLAGVENQAGFQDGDAKTALFYAPLGVAVGDDKIFVADTYNDRIRVIDNGQVRTLAGGRQGFADSDNGLSAMFNTPSGLALTADGKLLVADSQNRRLRIVEPTGKTSTLIGNGTADWVDGDFSKALLVEPTAVTVSPKGAIYLTDGNSVRVIENRPVPVIKTISNDRHGFADGSTATAQFSRPSGLALNEKGELFVADSENQLVRVFTNFQTGQELNFADFQTLRGTAEQFRTASAPRWPYDPPENLREIAGTLGEIRGEISDSDDPVYFHNGLDIVGGYGETARFIRSEKVLRPTAAENFGTLRELLRLPTLGYVHIRLGRDKDDTVFDDKRFLFSKDEKGKLNGVRVPRGVRFEAGEAIGTLNAMNHVHLVAGRSGSEMNALDALQLPKVSDKIPPVIEKVTLADKNWQPVETDGRDSRITLDGKTRIVARAYDRMDGNAERRRLGVFKLGYQILKEDRTPLGEMNWTIRFDRLPEHDAVRLVYAKDSHSGATGETIFNYIVSNEVFERTARESFFDAGLLEKGNYILRVAAADYFGNVAEKDLTFQIR